MKRLILFFIILSAVCSIMPAPPVFATTATFLDGRLHDVKGGIQQDARLHPWREQRDVTLSSFRTTFRVEGLLDVIQKETFDLKLYGLLNYWVNSADHMDDNLRDAIRMENPGNALNEFRRANDEDDIIKELYLDMTWGDDYQYNLRLGKQMISWGEAAATQVADVINPLNVADLVAFPAWEDYKIGLWMARFLWIPVNMWQSMSFELLIIPEFQTTVVPPYGTNTYFAAPVGLRYPLPFGSNGPRSYYWPAYFGWLNRKAMSDADDGFSWKNLEIGLRVRGFTYGFDWTVFGFWTRRDSPVYDGASGRANLVAHRVNRAISDLNIENPSLGIIKRKTGRIYKYPRFFVLGFTFNKPGPWKTRWKGEVTFNFDKEFNYQGPRGIIDKYKTRDVVTTAIGVLRTNEIPWLSRINQGRALTTNVTWYHFNLLGRNRDQDSGYRILWENSDRNSYDYIAFSIATSFFYSRLTTACDMIYYFDGRTTIVPTLSYRPGSWIGDHFKVTVQYSRLNERAQVRDHHRVRDSIRIRLTWDF